MFQKKKSKFNRSDKNKTEEQRIKHFTSDINDIIIEFIHSDDTKLDLKPMNSFFRRITHLEAQRYNINTESIGESIERYPVLIKTETTLKPEDLPKKNWDFSQREFFISPDVLKKEISLLKNGEIRLSETKNQLDESLEIDRKVIINNTFTVKNNQIVEINN